MTSRGQGRSHPEVSVVIPTLDRWPLLARAVGGALSQREVDLEVIVVDDGSSDPPPHTLAEHGDPRVRIVRHDTNTGVARSRNHAIDAARGHWIAFLDDDDLWAPRKLAAQLEAATGGAGWIWTAATVVDERLRPLHFARSPTPEAMNVRLLANNLIPALSSVIVRADVLREVGRFDESLSAMADWDLWIRLAAAAPGGRCPKSLVAYVQHGGNMLAASANPQQARPEFDRLAAKHGPAAARAGIAFGQVWWTRWVASNHRFAGRRLEAARTYLRGAREQKTVGDLLRAAGALAGPRMWGPARALSIGRAAAPDWLAAYRSDHGGGDAEAASGDGSEGR